MLVVLLNRSSDLPAPLNALYARYGFERCPPFADYVLDESGVCMTRELG